MGKQQVFVADVMTVDPIVVSLDTTLEEADTIIRSTFVAGLPVVDGDGVLVGVIGDAHLATYRFGQRMTSSEESLAKSESAR
jgi:CBS domain-containing protein